MAVVGYPHDIKGEGIFAYVVVKHVSENVDIVNMEKELRALCKSKIAGYAVPDFVLVSENGTTLMP